MFSILLIFIIIILLAHYLPFITWLSLSFLKSHRKEGEDPNRKTRFSSFLITFPLINVVSRIFHISVSYSLTIMISIAVLFNIYMLVTVIKDKRAMRLTAEN
jgi:hypothetical protein